MEGKVIRIRGETYELLKRRITTDEVLTRDGSPDTAVRRALLICPSCELVTTCNDLSIPLVSCAMGKRGEIERG